MQGSRWIHEECVEHCRRLDYTKYEIILLPVALSEDLNDIKAILTGSITPGAEGNIGVATSKGDICVQRA